MAGLTYREQIRGFPVKQMLVVSLMRFSEPIAFTSLFPYLYFMIRDFKIAPTEQEISKYSGYLALSFAFFQFCFAVHWGKMLDKIGRKPVIMCGLMGTSLSLLIFGFSRNYWMALFARSLAGCLNGNVSVYRTMIGEICVERRHQALGFSTLPLLFNVGTVIGPLIGGSRVFTRPSPHSPYEDARNNKSGGDSGGQLADVLRPVGGSGLGAFLDEFRTRHPYALSNFMVSAILWCSVIIGFLFLEETHEKFKNRRDYGVELGDSIMALFGRRKPVRPWNQPKEANETMALLSESEIGTSASPQTGSTTTVSVPSNVSDHADSLHAGSDVASIDSEQSSQEFEAVEPFMSKSMSNAVVRRYSLASVFKPEKNALTPQVITVIAASCIISLHSISYGEFMPVFLAARFKKDDLQFPFKISGGFGLDSSYIGTLFSSTGLVGMLIVLVIFPWIDRSLGTIEGFRLSLCFFPVVYACVPLSIFTLHKYNEAFPSWLTPIVLYALTSFKTLASATGMPQVMLLNHRAAAKEHRAYVNSLSMSMLALTRCIGPIVFGYVMTLGDSWHIGWLSWWLMALLALFGLVQSLYMKDYED